MASFKAPTEAQVKEVLRKILTTQLRRAFFEGLRNPLWVEPLAKEGAFANPPEPEQAGDGLVRDVYWPEMDYLVRMAPDVPAAVVDVLRRLSKSNNAWVRRGVFTVGANIPADQAARLQPLIKSWIPSGFGWRTDPQELVGFAVNLLQGGQYEVGTWIASILFTPGAARDRRKPSYVLEDYWYEEGLPRVVAVLSENGLAVALPWLVAYERHEGRLKRGSDITFLTRDSIRTRTDSHGGVEDALIDAVRDLAIAAMLEDAEQAKSLLLSVKMILARKIALFSLGEALTQAAGNQAQTQQLLRVAAELLLDPKSLDDSCRIEYGELARSVSALSAEALEPVVEVFSSGSKVNDELVRQRFGRDGADDEVLDEQVKQSRDRWLHRWLSAIGLDALPEQMRTQLADLDDRLGVIESPLTPQGRITGWIGPSSPLGQDEMSVMSPTELVAHLETWRDTGDGWGPEPSHEGQGRELTALLSTNPKAVLGTDNLVERLRPTYLRAILQGWEAALKAGLDLDWLQSSELIRGVLTHGDESTFPVEGRDFDDDADFRGAKKAAIGLLGELVKQRTDRAIPDDTMAEFAAMLVGLAEDETAWAQYISDDHESGMDPLTVSLNWQWPMRLRGLIDLMSHGKDAIWYENARSALERELARDDTRGASRAVLGAGLGRLISTDPEWTERNVPIWFGGEDRTTADQQIALTTAMAVHHYHPKLYEILAPSMLAAIGSKDPVAVGWRTDSDPLQRIGEWAIEAVIRGDRTPDDSVVNAFFTLVPAKVRGQAIAHVAWSFMHAQSVDEVIRDRFAELWDSRVEHVRPRPGDKEELNGFFWFVKSGKFSTEWWLPRLKDAITLDPYLSSERSMIGKEIASAADVDPRGALAVLRLLLEGRDDAGMAVYDLTRHAVPIVLARAIESGDAELKADAETYMNELGENGHLSLEAEVKAVLKGSIAQDDVDA